MSTSRLPLELYSLIIPSLSEDKDALKALAGSWRGFTLFSHRLYFAHIILQPPWKPEAPPAPSIDFPPGYHNICGLASAFRRLLDASPHIGEYVRSLEVSHQKRRYYDEPTNEDLAMQKLYEQDLLFCFTKFTQLQALVVTCDDTRRPVSQTLLHGIRQILQLPSFVHLDLGGIPGALSIAQQYGKQTLKHLVLHWNGVDPALEQGTHIDTASSCDPVVLQSLYLGRWCDMAKVEAALLNPKNRVSLKGLRKLVASLRDEWEDYEALGRILQLSQSLDELILDWPFCPVYENIEELFHFDCLPSLKRFHVNIDCGTSHYYVGMEDEFGWFIGFLARAITTVHPLEELSIEQELSCDDEDRVQDHMCEIAHGWGNVTDILLNSGNYPSLRKFKLCISAETLSARANAVAFLKSCDFTKLLASRLDVTIFPRIYEPCLPREFLADDTWLSLQDRHNSKQLLYSSEC